MAKQASSAATSVAGGASEPFDFKSLAPLAVAAAVIVGVIVVVKLILASK